MDKTEFKDMFGNPDGMEQFVFNHEKSHLFDAFNKKYFGGTGGMDDTPGNFVRAMAEIEEDAQKASDAIADAMFQARKDWFNILAQAGMPALKPGAEAKDDVEQQQDGGVDWKQKGRSVAGRFRGGLTASVHAPRTARFR